MKSERKYTWAKQTLAPELEIIECPVYDAYKDFNRDPAGCYTLIRVNLIESKIETAICNKDHVIVKVFKGRKAQDVYEAIFRYEKKHELCWFKDKGHCAYLGKELKKAEQCLDAGRNDYYQE
jgi:hypothetical protein